MVRDGDAADDNCRRCNKNSSAILPSTDKRVKIDRGRMTSTMGQGQFTVGKNRKGQFLCRNWKFGEYNILKTYKVVQVDNF